MLQLVNLKKVLVTSPWLIVPSQINSVFKICLWTGTPPKMPSFFLFEIITNIFQQSAAPSPALTMRCWDFVWSSGKGWWDGCELLGVRIHLLTEVYSEGRCSQTEAPEVLGEGNLFKCVVPGDTALLFTGATGFHALQELLWEQREVVNVNRGKKLFDFEYNLRVSEFCFYVAPLGSYSVF